MNDCLTACCKAFEEIAYENGSHGLTASDLAKNMYDDGELNRDPEKRKDQYELFILRTNRNGVCHSDDQHVNKATGRLEISSFDHVERTDLDIKVVLPQAMDALRRLDPKIVFKDTFPLHPRVLDLTKERDEAKERTAAAEKERDEGLAREEKALKSAGNMEKMVNSLGKNLTETKKVNKELRELLARYKKKYRALPPEDPSEDSPQKDS